MRKIEYKSKICVLCNMKFKSQAHNAKYCEKCKKKANNPKSNRINISKDELHELYIIQNMSISQIATHFKCSNRTIYNRINEFNIPLKKNYNSYNYQLTDCLSLKTMALDNSNLSNLGNGQKPS